MDPFIRYGRFQVSSLCKRDARISAPFIVKGTTLNSIFTPDCSDLATASRHVTGRDTNYSEALYNGSKARYVILSPSSVNHRLHHLNLLSELQRVILVLWFLTMYS